jgi:hypothetical protein
VKILFLHGWNSTMGGVKPTYLAELGHEVLNPTLPDDDFDEAIRIDEQEWGERVARPMITAHAVGHTERPFDK